MSHSHFLFAHLYADGFVDVLTYFIAFADVGLKDEHQRSLLTKDFDFLRGAFGCITVSWLYRCCITKIEGKFQHLDHF